jgi:hypothetical protein
MKTANPAGRIKLSPLGIWMADTSLVNSISWCMARVNARPERFARDAFPKITRISEFHSNSRISVVVIPHNFDVASSAF